MPDSSTNARLRVAWVSDGLPVQGTTTYLLNYARWLKLHDIDSFAYSFQEPPSAIRVQFAAEGIPIGDIPSQSLIFEDRLSFILKQVADLRPHILIANHQLEAFEVLRYAPPGVKRIGILHSDHPSAYAFAPDYADNLDTLISVSETILKRVSSYPELQHGVQHLWLPGTVEAPTDVHRSFPLQPDELSVLYVGRLDHDQKRAHLLPDIALQVKQAHIPARFTVVGDGVATPDIREKIQRYQLEDTFTLLPAQNAAQVKELMLTHDVFLFPTAYEGPPFPLALLEAMSCSMAWVMSDIPTGIREEMAGKPSLLVSPENIPGYAAAINRLWNEPQLGSSISAVSQAIVREKYTVETLGPRWLSLLKSETSSHSTPPTWPQSPSLLQPYFLRGTRYHPALRWLRRKLSPLK